MPTNDSSLPAFAFEAEAAIQGALRHGQAFGPVCESAQTESVITGVSGPFADALRAEGAAVERERIRLEMVQVADEADAELDRLYPRSKRVPWRLAPRALREFSRRLEAKP